MPKLTPSPFELSDVVGLPDKGDPVVYNEIDDLIRPPFGTPTKEELETVDALTGTDGRDKITVHNGADVVHALGDDDLMIDLAYGDDQFFGEDGDDRFVLGRGDDFVDGGKGTDTLDYSGSDVRVSAHLSRGTIFADGVDEVESVENITGSNLDDILIGDAGTNVLHGMGGNDKITGAVGRRFFTVDALYGDGGNDTIVGRGLMHGGDDNDTITSVTYERPRPTHPWYQGDTQHGDRGDDTLTGGFYSDKLYGGPGNDVIDGRTGNDLIDGGDGVNKLSGGSGNDTFAFQRFGGDHVYDWILDFDAEEDKLDLRRIDADPTIDGIQGFVFTNSANLYDDDYESSIGGPAIDGFIGRVSTKVGDGYTYVYIQDEEGWQAADIVLTGEHTLTADNFIL